MRASQRVDARARVDESVTIRSAENAWPLLDEDADVVSQPSASLLLLPTMRAEEALVRVAAAVAVVVGPAGDDAAVVRGPRHEHRSPTCDLGELWERCRLTERFGRARTAR